MEGRSKTTAKMTNVPDASAWSKHSDKFNGPSGKPLTLPMVRSAFEAQWFSKLDAAIAAKKAPLRVLCLACGTGAEVDVLCSRYDETQMSVLATDFAPGMVDATKRLVAQAGKEAMVQTKVMDAMSIEADDGAFDVVFLVLGPMLMPDPAHVFREIQRVLVAGGWSAYLTPNHMETHDAMIEAKIQTLAAAGQPKPTSFYDTSIMREWGTPDALTAQLQAARFANVEASVVRSVLPLQRGAEVDEMLSRLFDNPGMMAFYTASMSPEQVQAFQAAVRAAFHSKWPTKLAPQPAEPYMTANAACAYKAAVNSA